MCHSGIVFSEAVSALQHDIRLHHLHKALREHLQADAVRLNWRCCRELLH